MLTSGADQVSTGRYDVGRVAVHRDTGMEAGAQHYQVLLVLKDGTTEVFAVH